MGERAVYTGTGMGELLMQRVWDERGSNVLGQKGTALKGKVVQKVDM